ncbi:MAG: virulence RhuM family protein [Clostridiales bacterium]|nr:virulence RhuM family protein [Clostridiales bacterium]HBZ77610.1 phosphoribosylaminoimidazolesuccinocarboxamide synthase [Clostridiales bacterium]
MENEMVLFETKDKEIKLNVSIVDDTVWLTQEQMSSLFDTARSTIAYHINQIFKEGELNRETSVEIFDRSTNTASRPPQYYNLDVIISVGYRVKSQRGIEFRQWANSVLKQYIINGYAINEKRLLALQKTVEIQSRMLADTLSVEQQDVLRTVSQYTEALLLLDQYDHHDLEKPEGTKPLYKLTYKDCRDIISRLETEYKSDVFGVEKEAGKVEGILGAVYQDVFGGEVYPSLEEKAANLLYFIIKDHPFNDGCKRIAASLFLEFLNRNGCLFKNGEKTISDGTLVAITLMIAESDPSDKEIMITLVMNLMNIR